MPDWVVALLAFCGATVGAVVTIFLQEFVLRPILVVDCVDDTVFGPASDGNDAIIYHRLRISNLGHRAADNCTGSLTLEEIRR